jgi:signal transduction histidine kinase
MPRSSIVFGEWSRPGSVERSLEMEGSSTRQLGGLRWFHRRELGESVKPSPESGRQEGVVAALEAIAYLLQSEASPSPLLAKLAEHAGRAMGADLVVIRRFQPEHQSLVTEAVAGIDSEGVAGLRGAVVTAPAGFAEIAPGTFAVVDLAGDLPSAYLGRTEAGELAELGIRQVLVLPLCIRGVVVGRAEFGRCSELPFPLERRAIARLLSPLLAEVLLTIAGFEEQRAIKKLRARAIVVDATDPAGALEEALNRIGQAAHTLVPTAQVLSLRWDPDRARFEPVGLAGGSPYVLDAWRRAALQPDTVPVFQDVAQAFEPVPLREEDVQQLLGMASVTELGTRAAMLVPLRDAEGRLLGVLVMLVALKERGIGPDDTAALGELARASTPVLTLTALTETLRREVERRRWFEGLLGALLTIEDEAALVRTACASLRSAVEAPVCLLGMVVEDKQRIAWHGWAGGQPIEPLTTPIGEDVASRALRQQAPLDRVRQVDERWLPPELGLPMLRSGFAVPVVVNGRVAAVLVLGNTVEETVQESDRDMALGVARWVGLVLARLQQVWLARDAGERRASLLGELLARQETERKQLVDVVHNVTLQGLASSLYRIELAARRADHQPLEATVEELRQIRDLLAQQIAELRESVFRLRPATLDHLGLEAAVREYLHHLRLRTTIDTALDTDLPKRLPPDLETTVYRLVCEAIESVRLKSGITRVLVRLRQRQDGAVVVTIADDGRDTRGASDVPASDDASAVDRSLLTLRERVALTGGAMRVAALPSGGTVLQIVLPDPHDT